MFLFNRETGEFSPFRHNPADTTSLSSNNVWTIYEDRSGRLWVGTLEKGLNLFERESEAFSRYMVNAPNEYLPEFYNNITCICEDRDGILWIGSQRGLTQFDRATKKFRTCDLSKAKAYNDVYRHLSNPIAVNINGIAEDKDGNLWLSSDYGLYLYDKSDNSSLYFKDSYNDLKSLSYSLTSELFVDQRNTLWIGTKGFGLNKYSAVSKRFKEYSYDRYLPNRIKPRSIRVIFTEKDRYLWVGGYTGLINLTG